jgi:cytochrome c oxidase cbb3-type subunit 3
MSTDAEVIATGKATFEANCVACHLSSLRGTEESPAAIGPSLVDSEWIHGGNPTDVMTVIVNGVPAKGMLAWGNILGEKRISEVAAYVLSHHTAPAE